MTRYAPERETVRLRTGTVNLITGTTVTLDFNGALIPNCSVHGPMPGQGAIVLVMEQGNSFTVLGDASTVTSEMRAIKEELGMLRSLYDELKNRRG